MDIVLERVHRADEELQLDGDWPGRTVLRGRGSESSVIQGDEKAKLGKTVEIVEHVRTCNMCNSSDRLRFKNCRRLIFLMLRNDQD